MGRFNAVVGLSSDVWRDVLGGVLCILPEPERHLPEVALDTANVLHDDGSKSYERIRIGYACSKSGFPRLDHNGSGDRDCRMDCSVCGDVGT